MGASCKICNRCQGCNTCEGCDSCLTCNICESCNNCQAPECETAQRLSEIRCPVLAQYEGGFDFSKCYLSGEIMGRGYFDQGVWDELADWINKREEVGEKSNGSPPHIASSTTEAVDPFSAEEFNRMARIVGANTVNKNDVIYGTYFENLVRAATDNVKIAYSACDKCNTDCDAEGCDKCLSVNYCAGCNKGLSNCYNRDPREMCDDTAAGA